MLTVASVLAYYMIPVITEPDLSEMIETQEIEIDIDADPSDPESTDVDSKEEGVTDNESFSVINEKNMFSHQRKEWVVKAVIPKASELKNKNQAKKDLAKKRALAEKPKKIILHGVVIAGDMKRALINNPLKGVSKKTTMYVEEGDELEGYKVTSIEKDQIRLDWHGEEIIVTLYSGLKDFKEGDSAGIRKQGSLSKLDYKFEVIDESQTEECTEISPKIDEKVALADIPDESSLNLVYKEPEYLTIPSFEDEQLTGAVEMPDADRLFSNIESNIISSSEEGQKTVKAQVPVFIDLPIKEKPKQKTFAEEQAEIVLHGIVIAGDIKKALVYIPMSDHSKEKTLHVEEGDGFEGYTVTSIESDKLRLDWHGEEMVVKFPPL